MAVPMPDPFTARQRAARRELAAAELAMRQFDAIDPLTDTPPQWSPEEQAANRTALGRLAAARDELAAANAAATE
jgi:hypothetical protein